MVLQQQPSTADGGALDWATPSLWLAAAQAGVATALAACVAWRRRAPALSDAAPAATASANLALHCNLSPGDDHLCV